ncbi:hypothetical protein [Streptomyces alkaliterrae]|uniref:Peptidase inhibitor family I36 n=1 Tax=Streptomyces alkaliterrae TaxID=2213162 RepID=A0A5P0Z025_9ACTN|nr:hypothetical protein [Streptomyces alkaliterrae]MBB1254408.1 hypothetical protein [Streptomyces alkaliterrae]MBB1259443.1 hypothetical protein [Streptomyces alkaliterrae]MQS04649.1 hypothetical protein [Streptomyces alkaliterrae]
MRARLSRVLAAAGGIVATVALAGPAQASPSATVDNCPSEYVCLYAKSGYMFAPTKGDADLSKSKMYPNRIFNNGKRYPGADHVYWAGKRERNGKVTDVGGCLHYHSTNNKTPEAGTYVTGLYKSDSDRVRITTLRWSGECP